jgi:rare lipoprotein A
VINLTNRREVVLRINDRGPFHDGRIIDVSRAAARRLGLVGPGTARVRVIVLGT